ncbi:MAG: type II secretion system protein GspD [Candidatus Riflebacteria bacterium]|nr:type II secretion system protein GspD [Candidatus Riflebacteria bacterium]
MKFRGCDFKVLKRSNGVFFYLVFLFSFIFSFSFSPVFSQTLSELNNSRQIPALVQGKTQFSASSASEVSNGGNGQAISMVVRDMPIEQALSQVGMNFGLQVFPQFPLQGTVNLDLQNATLDEAMNQIVGPLELEWMVEGNRLHIFKPRQPWAKFKETSAIASLPMNLYEEKKAEPKVSRIVPLVKRKVEDIQKLLKELNPQINLVQDGPTNALVVMGTESQVTEAETLAKNLDELPAIEKQASSSILVKKEEYFNRVYKLEHVDFDSLERELMNIIPRMNGGTGGIGGVGMSGGMGMGGMGMGMMRDKDGKPIDMEYFVLDRDRRIVMVHTTREKMYAIEVFFEQINQPLAQVLIEAQIVALDSDFERDMGIKWNTQVGYQGPGVPWSTGGNQPAAQPGEAAQAGPQSFQFGKWNLQNLQAILNTAQTQNKAQVLSRPRIMSLSGRQASIHVGKDIPYTTAITLTTGGNSIQNVSFIKTGINLDVTPTVMTENQTIRLLVQPEVSESIGTANNGAPILSTRGATATIELKDGETMVIGGLLSNEDSHTGGGIPLLRSIPGLGGFFKFHNRIRRKSNLIILLTTRLVNKDFRTSVNPNTVASIANLLGTPGMEGVPLVASMVEPIMPIWSSSTPQQSQLSQTPQLTQSSLATQSFQPTQASPHGGSRTPSGFPQKTFSQATNPAKNPEKTWSRKKGFAEDLRKIKAILEEETKTASTSKSLQ